MPSFVAYLRASALPFIPLHQQRQHIALILKSPKWLCEEEFVEAVEGSVSGRPGLRTALEACHDLDVVLAVARLEHAMRDDDFIPMLRGSGVSFIVCDVRDEDLTSVVALARDLSPIPQSQTKAHARHATPRFEPMKVNAQIAGDAAHADLARCSRIR